MSYRIIASYHGFPDIQTAAYAENQIDWQNPASVPLQDTCTIAWTAYKLKQLFHESEYLSPDDFSPEPDNCYLLLGNAGQNSAVARLEADYGEKLTAEESLGAEGFRMKGFFAKGAEIVVLSGNTRVGTMYAAFAFCERCGIRFTEPGMICRNDALFSREHCFDISEKPDFISRGTFSSYVSGENDFLEWMAFNRMNFTKFKGMASRSPLLRKLGIACSEGGHELYYRFVETSHEYPYCHKIWGGEGKPEDPYPVSRLCRAPSGKNGVLTYGDAHPEWYALVNGERRMYRDNEAFLKFSHKIGDNLCTGNPDAVKELTRLVVEALTDGIWKYADYVDIWALDNGTWCECELCQAQGNYATRLLLLAYTIDKAIKQAQREGKIHRTIRLMVPAYHETLPAPDRPLPEDFDYSTCMVVFFPIERCFVHDFDDTCCTETNAELVRRWLPWTKESGGYYQGDLFMGEYYNVSTFAAMPFVLKNRILHDIPYYYRTGARHFHYMHIPARDWGFIAVNNWLYPRLLWNVNTDGEEELNGYFSARYGAQAEEMRQLYDTLEQVTANCKYYKHYQFVNGKIQSLFRKLAAGNASTEEELFPLEHMRLHTRADSVQAGPSLQETLEGLEKAETALEKICRECREDTARPYLERDVR